jgi:DNA-binding NarL/FixJ family response regulator
MLRRMRHHHRVTTRAGARESSLAAFLDAVVGSEIDTWAQRAAAATAGPSDPEPDTAWSDGLQLLAAALSREWDAAVALHRVLPDPGPDAEARWLRRGAHAWASSGDPVPGASAALDGLLGDLPDLEGALGRFAAYLYVEGALAHGQLDLAQQLVDACGERLWAPLVLGGREHAFSPILVICRTRLLAFRGELAAADEVYRGLPRSEAARSHPVIDAVWAATGTLVLGNEADTAEARRLAAQAASLAGTPRDHVTAATHLLVAFGLIALGDVTAAVRSLLATGRDADLSGCNVIDRALGLELLVALAVAESDLDTARAWLDRAEPLLASASADSTVARMRCRVHLLEGRTAEAIVWAELALARAEANGRGIEAAEAEILLTRSRLAHRGPGDRAAALTQLQAVVARTEALGHLAARRAAARELRPLGLRLKPLAGSGWAGLSDREAEIGRLVADGATNRQVAQLLHLSEHTVRAHVSRVLAAFSVATRSGLPAAMAAAGWASEAPERTSYGRLTPRQEQVAALVADGLSNRDIGERLGLSVRTVERHVGDVLERWGLPGRTALARVVGWQGEHALTATRQDTRPSGDPRGDRPPS